MNNRKQALFAMIIAFVVAAFAVLATRVSPTENPNKEAAPATVSTPLPEKDACGGKSE